MASLIHVSIVETYSGLSDDGKNQYNYSDMIQGCSHLVSLEFLYPERYAPNYFSTIFFKRFINHGNQSDIGPVTMHA